LIPISCGPSGSTQEPFHDFLTEIFKTWTRAEWENWFQDKDICFAPVLDLKETWAQPQVASCEMLLRDQARNLHIGTPLKFKNEPGSPSLTLPELDEHENMFRKKLSD
jgi:crotonobetainyl-CoA:carnitine CoA-transferase CaiB-like acyl-CoA transferase